MNEKDLFGALVNVLPMPLFVVDSDVRIVTYNAAAVPLLGPTPDSCLNTRMGEVLNCSNHFESENGCGTSMTCSGCIVRNSVTTAFHGNKVVRNKTRLTLLAQSGEIHEMFLYVTCAPFIFSGRNLALLVLEDISDIVELRRLLPVCSYCKKVRNDREYWDRIEEYIESRLGTEITHGICPECLAKLKVDWTL